MTTPAFCRHHKPPRSRASPPRPLVLGILALLAFLALLPPAPAEAQMLSISGLSSTSIAENTAFSQTATTSNAVGAVSWTLEGEDAGDFSISTAGVLTMTARNYEDPADGATGGDNTYNVTVRATDSKTPTAQTATQSITVTITDATEPPGKVGRPNLFPATSTSMGVFWEAPANTGPDINDYDVQYRRHDSSTWSSHSFTGTATETTITGLTTNQRYVARVRANNAEGSGAWSDGSGRTLSTTVGVSLGTFANTPTSMSTYSRGERIVLSVNASQLVTVTGRPRIALDIGGVTRYAVYVVAAGRLGTRFLNFAYTVQATDRDTDGIAIPRNALQLNGGTITRADDSSVNATITAQSARAADPARKVNGSTVTRPKLQAVPGFYGTPESMGTYRRGEHIEAVAIMSQHVSVTGRPRIALDIGGVTRYASYRHTVHRVGHSILFFQYTVQQADRDTDGISIPRNALELNGGSIVRRGNSSVTAELAHAGHSVVSANRKVNGALLATAPSVTSVAFCCGLPLGGDTYARGEKISAVVYFNKPVSVTGSPRLALSVGANTRQAAFERLHAWDFAAIFSYTVQAGDTDTDGVSIAASALNLNGGTITLGADSSVNATLTHKAVAAASARKVDGSIAMPQSTRFAISGLSSVSIAHGIAFSQTATTANADGAVTWTLEGVDADDFSISSSGVLRMTARDYHNPTDEGRDNTYRVSVRATDSAASVANTATESVTVTVTMPRTLTASAVTQTGARLTIGNHAAAWWYRKTSPTPAGTCTAVNAGTTHVDLTGLTAGTSYTYKAYSNSGCTTELASRTFGTASTNPRTPTNVRATTHHDRLSVWVILHWDHVPGATMYEYRYRVPGGDWITTWYDPWVTAINGVVNDCAFPCHYVWYANSPSTTYEFQVRASRSSYGRREWTSGASVTVSATTGTAGTAGASDPGDGATAAVSLSAAPDPVDEGLPVTVTATLSRALSSRVTIPLAVTPVTAEARDVGAPPSVTIAGGSTTGTALMNTRMDADGDDETFRVGLDTANLPSSVTAGDAASDTVTITDTTTGSAEPLVLFPNPPASVRADPGDRQAVLSWSAVEGANGWEVEKDGGGAWTATGGTARTHTVTGLTNGTAYTFKVRATGLLPVLKGNASEGVSVTAGLPAAPGAVASVRVSHRGSSLAVSWEAPARATHYDVGFSADGGATWTGAASNRAGTSLSISGADRTKSYTVRVRARNAGGQAGWTGSASVSYAAPAAPASVSVIHNESSLAVSWDASAGAESYRVDYSGDGGGSWSTATPKQTGTSLTIGGVDGTTTYTVRVRARNAAGASGWTRSAAARGPRAGPDAVASVSVVHNGTSLGVSWTAPAGATSYDVAYTDANDISWQRAAWDRAGAGLTITTNVDGAAPVDAAKTYLVGVRARNANGESAWTNSAPASRTPATAPDAVAAVSVVHNGTSLDVSWEAPARAAAYDVTYADANDISWQRAAWNRAGAGLTITANVDGNAAIDGAKTYLVGVRARNAAGESAWTSSAATALAAPDRAAIWFVTPGAGRLDVYVVRPARTAGYEARTKTGGGSDCAAGTWGAAAAVSHTHVPEFEADRLAVTGLTGGTAYCVQVRAANANGRKGAWSAAETATTPESALSVADATVAEPGAGQTATLDFVVTLAPASSGTVTVDYATGKAGDTATKGSDYTATTGTLTFAAGETSKTVSVPVLADSLDDGGETLTLTLSNASGATLSDAEATGTITNDGPMPKAWTARFGRTVADQVLGAVESRMQAGREPGAEASLAGTPLGLGPLLGAGSGEDAGAALKRAEARKEAERLAAWLAGEEEDPAGHESRTVSGRALLVGSSFALTAQTAGGGSAAFWGRGAVTRFDGREGETSLDGEVATALLGADWSLGRATAGLVVGHSRGEGDYRGATGGGTVSSTLTGLWPWGRYALSERVTAWGVAGFGEGTLGLTPESGDGGGRATLRADLDLAMGAAGLRGTLLDGGGEGLTLAAKTDALAVRTSTGRGRGADGGILAASEATVTRLRLGLEARRPIELGDPGAGSGATLTPSFETAVRHDGGDAETGFGLDLGGGLALSAPASGFEAELRARGLLTHEAGGFRERGLSGALHWRQRPDSDRGATLSLTQTVGASSSGGADALLSRTTLDGLAANDDAGGAGDDLAARRLEARLGYGLPAFGGRLTLTPEAGAGLADTGRDVRLGLRLTPAAGAGAFELVLEAARREAANDDAGPVHDLRLGLTARF